MKKIISFLILISLSFSLFACNLNSNNQNNLSASINQFNVSTQSEIEEIFTDFITKNPNRNAFDLGEEFSSIYIESKLGEWFNSDQIAIEEFSYDFTVAQGTILIDYQVETRYSQNVVLSLRASDPNESRKIVIGSDYDNNYTSSQSVGALDNATGVSACLALAKSLKDKDLPYNVDIVFFGAGYYNYLGSESYINKHLLANVITMINLTRIGMPNTYVYCDENEPPLQDFVLNASDFISKVPPNIPLMAQHYINGYPYAHLGMLGNHSAFLSKGVSTINIFGGDSKYLNLQLQILNDTKLNMETLNPNCYNEITKVVNLTHQLILDPQIAVVANESTTALNSPLMKTWIAYIIFIALVGMCLIALYFTNAHLVKKQPKPSVKKVDSPFGSEYE